MDEATVRRRLRDEREELLDLQRRVERREELDESQQEALSSLSSIDQHPADQATETFEREKDLSILEGLDERLSAIDAALQRLEQGTYGRCEACGRPIAEERLEAIPTARYCVDDQARAERQGAGRET